MTFTANKNLERPVHGADVDTWDQPMNSNYGLIDLALGGSTTLNATGASGAVSFTQTQATPPTIIVSGLPVGDTQYQLPSGIGGAWSVSNITTGGFVISFSSLAGGSALEIPVGVNTLISCDGTSRGMVYSSQTDPADRALTLIDSITPNGTLSYGLFTDLVAGDYQLRVRGLNCATDTNFLLQFSVDNSANWLTTGTYNSSGSILSADKSSATGPITGAATSSNYSGGAGTTAMLIQAGNPTDSTAGTAGYTATLDISIVSGGPTTMKFTGDVDCNLSGTRTWQSYIGSGSTYGNTALKNAFRIVSGTGANITTGALALYRYAA